MPTIKIHLHNNEIDQVVVPDGHTLLITNLTKQKEYQEDLEPYGAEINERTNRLTFDGEMMVKELLEKGMKVEVSYVETVENGWDEVIE